MIIYTIRHNDKSIILQRKISGHGTFYKLLLKHNHNGALFWALEPIYIHCIKHLHQHIVLC